MPLARLGYRVTGLDLSRSLLARAAATAAEQRQRVGLVEADRRRLPFAAGTFDAVHNLFHLRTSRDAVRWAGLELRRDPE